MAALLRILVFVILGRLFMHVLQALGQPGRATTRRPPSPPPTPQRATRRPAGGDIVDAEFEDLADGGR